MEERRAEVSIVPCGGYAPEQCAAALKEALAPFGGLGWVSPGMKVAVKVNLVMAKGPEAAATTHPALVCALCDMLAARGAEVTVGDSPGGPFTQPFLSLSYAATGMAEVEKHGARLNRDFAHREVDNPGGKAARRLHLTSYLLEADAIINFCKLKTHGLMAFSGACKNMFGAIQGFSKLEYHHLYPRHEDFAEMLVDINAYLKPRLCIADGVVGMEGNGPTAGTPRFIGAVMASPCPHSLDLAAAHLMGLSPADVPTLAAACGRGLIPRDQAELAIHGDLEAFVVPDYQRIPIRSVLEITGGGRALQGLVGAVFSRRPRVEKAECVGCGECARICPAHAIVMRNRLPAIDRGKCIRCFCCQEFCPKGAMKVHRPAAARLLNH